MGKHLGVTLEDRCYGLKADIMLKRAQYIARNCKLLQEFDFCHPDARSHLNMVYNTSFHGSPLWDLFGAESIKLEKSWNISMRLMFDLPRSTHRNLIEAIFHLK